MSIAHCITSLAYDEDGATFSRILCENFEFSKLTKTTKMSNSKLEFIQRKFSHQLLKTYHSSDAVDCNPDFMKSALLQRIICRHMGRIWREFKILFSGWNRKIDFFRVFGIPRECRLRVSIKKWSLHLVTNICNMCSLNFLKKSLA